MSAIEASSVRVNTMADGTLRLIVDIEPRFAVDAFRLFGSPGVPMALAALQPVAAVPEVSHCPTTSEQTAPKGGTLAKWCALRCQESTFHEWCMAEREAEWDSAHGSTSAQWAASVIRAVCSIESRAELDNDPKAAARFHDLIRKPYQAWLEKQA